MTPSHGHLSTPRYPPLLQLSGIAQKSLITRHRARKPPPPADKPHQHPPVTPFRVPAASQPWEEATYVSWDSHGQTDAHRQPLRPGRSQGHGHPQLLLGERRRPLYRDAAVLLSRHGGRFPPPALPSCGGRPGAAAGSSRARRSPAGRSARR